MLALQIEIDGDDFVVAGAEDWAVLALHVTASRSDASERPFSHAGVSVGGLSLPDGNSQQHHFRWKDRALKVGSRITVTLIDTDAPHPPVKRFRSDAEVQENPYTEDEMRQMRRQDYLELKKEFEGEIDLYPVSPWTSDGRRPEFGVRLETISMESCIGNELSRPAGGRRLGHGRLNQSPFPAQVPIGAPPASQLSAPAPS